MRLQPAIMCGSLAAFLSGTGSLARPLDVVKSSGSLSSGQYDSVKRSLRGPLNWPINDGEDERGNFAAAYDSAVENLRSLGPTAEALRAEEIENIADNVLVNAEYMHQETYLKVREFIKKPELEKWTELMDWDKFASQNDESALENLFFNRYTFNELCDFTAAARKFPPAESMANKVESWLRNNHPFFLMGKFVRNYNIKTLGACPELYKWFDYIAHYNKRYAEKQSTVSNALQGFYTDEYVTSYCETMRKVHITKELTSEEHEWLDTATPPKDVFIKLNLHIKDNGFFNQNSLPGQIKMMDDFYKLHSKLQISFRAILPFTDKKLLDLVFFELKTTPHKDGLKVRALKGLYEAWIAKDCSPYEVASLFGLDKISDHLYLTPRLKSWEGYVYAYSDAKNLNPRLKAKFELKKAYNKVTISAIYERCKREKSNKRKHSEIR